MVETTELVGVHIKVTSPLRGKLGKLYREVFIKDILAHLNKPGVMRRLNREMTRRSKGINAKAHR